mgnify:CR=1 FL=1
MIRVVVVDDHKIVRQGIIAYLNTVQSIEIVGEASSGHEAVELVRDLQPDVVLMDLVMENGTGVDATKEIMRFLPDCKIIILTSYYDDEKVFPAIEAGAFSYLLKTASANDIVEAIHKAMNNENVIEPKVASKVISGIQGQSKKPHQQLTKRELEVLLCIGNGMTNQEISDKLYIGIKTVKTHVSNILAKLGVHDRTQAAVYVHRNRLLE